MNRTLSSSSSIFIIITFDVRHFVPIGTNRQFVPQIFFLGRHDVPKNLHKWIKVEPGELWLLIMLVTLSSLGEWMWRGSVTICWDITISARQNGGDTSDGEGGWSREWMIVLPSDANDDQKKKSCTDVQKAAPEKKAHFPLLTSSYFFYPMIFKSDKWEKGCTHLHPSDPLFLKWSGEITSRRRTASSNKDRMEDLRLYQCFKRIRIHSRLKEARRSGGRSFDPKLLILLTSELNNQKEERKPSAWGRDEEKERSLECGNWKLKVFFSFVSLTRICSISLGIHRRDSNAKVIPVCIMRKMKRSPDSIITFLAFWIFLSLHLLDLLSFHPPYLNLVLILNFNLYQLSSCCCYPTNSLFT